MTVGSRAPPPPPEVSAPAATVASEEVVDEADVGGWVEDVDVVDDVVPFDVREGFDAREEDVADEPLSRVVVDEVERAVLPVVRPEVGAAVPPGSGVLVLVGSVAVEGSPPPDVGRGAAVVRGASAVARAVGCEVVVGAVAVGAGAGGATLGDWLEPRRKPTEVPDAGSYS